MRAAAQLTDVETLGSQSLGNRLLIRGLGRSMHPLIRSGDVLAVERCTQAGVRRGDVAVVKDSAEQFRVHLVVSARPITTAALGGAEDPRPLEVVGRVFAVQRSWLTLPLPRASRPLVCLAHQLLRWAGFRLFGARAWALLSALCTAPITRPFRRKLLEPVRVRQLNLGDLEPLMIFAGRHLSASPKALRRLLVVPWPKSAAGVGAFDRHQRLVGLACRSDLREERFNLGGLEAQTVYVSPIARGFDLERRMVELLCQRERNKTGG